MLFCRTLKGELHAHVSAVVCLPRLPSLGSQDAGLPVVRSTTQEVLLDVVVRDRKERLIRNLKPAELRVLEDGVPQELKTFHPRGRRASGLLPLPRP